MLDQMVRRILVVEDDLDHATILRIILVGMGCTVIWTADLAAARQALATPPPPTLVVLDRMLPDGDGLALCRELAARTPGLPIIVLTAQWEPSLPDEAAAAGAAACLPKPFDPEEFERTVRRLIRP